MEDLIKEVAEEFKAEFEQDVRAIYCDELNYNNADTTSGQICYDEEQIRTMLFKEIVKLLGE